MLILVLALGCAPERAGAPKVRDGVSEETQQGIDVAYVDVRELWLPDVLPASRRSPVVADITGDGIDDIVEATALGVVAMPGTGAGWDAPTVLSGSTPADLVRVADLDGDGLPDLLASGEGGVRVRLQEAAGWSAATILSESPARGAEFADLDGDADLDLVFITDTQLWAMVNDGAGGFTALTGSLVTDVVAGAIALTDLDGDGHLDLLVGGDADPDRLYLGDGAGGFLLAGPTALPLQEAPGVRAVVPVDLDGDGDLDLFLAGVGQDRVLRNTGEGRFEDDTPFVLGVEADTAVAAATVDLDLDGRPDLVVAHDRAPLRLLRQDAQGRFFDWSARFPGAAEDARATGLARLDLEGDGDTDLYVPRGDLQLPWLLRSWAPEELLDTDQDGVPDSVDVCPSDADPLQSDVDAHPYACAGAADCRSATGCQLIPAATDLVYLWCDGAEASWADARARCQALGADLAAVPSAPVLDFLVDAGVAGAWLGLHEADGVEGAWTWTDGSAATWVPWGEGEPNDSGDGEDCGQLRSDGLWNDAPCDRPKPYVCQAPGATSAVDRGDACDNCPRVPNADQADENDDGVGDACEDG